jgi:nucleotide-binding universal stress UspA family protein
VDFALRIFPDAEFSIIHVDETTQLGQNEDYSVSPAGAARRHQIEDMVTARFLTAGRSRPGTANGPALIFGNGKAANVLQEKIAQLSLELVVVGTHTRTGVTKMFLGSVAETLLDVLPNDVLIVRT